MRRWFGGSDLEDVISQGTGTFLSPRTIIGADTVAGLQAGGPGGRTWRKDVFVLFTPCSGCRPRTDWGWGGEGLRVAQGVAELKEGLFLPRWFHFPF